MITGHAEERPNNPCDGRGDVSSYVLILGGLLSHSQVSPVDHRLRDDFAPLLAHLATGLPGRRVISFSYAAAGLLMHGGDPREAWVGAIPSAGAEPRYTARDTTDHRLADHVRALDWLIADLRARSPHAPIHMVGFSLGGIVALSWAATAPAAALTGIRRLILISTPAGGISSLALLAPTPGIRHVLGRFRIGFGHGHIFRDLRAGSPAMRQLRGAIGRLEIDAVENSRDYLTNGRRIAGQRLLPRRLRTIPLGHGVCTSGLLPPERCLTVDLGGWEHHLRTTHHRILRGHSPRLEHLRVRIAQQITLGSDLALPADPHLSDDPADRPRFAVTPGAGAQTSRRRHSQRDRLNLRAGGRGDAIARQAFPVRVRQREHASTLVHARPGTRTLQEVSS